MDRRSPERKEGSESFYDRFKKNILHTSGRLRLPDIGGDVHLPYKARVLWD